MVGDRALRAGAGGASRAREPRLVAHERPWLGRALREGGRPSRLRGALVVSQLALSAILIVAASLFVRSLVVARTVDIGFDARDRVLLSMNVGLQGYDSTRGRRFYDDVLARARTLPSVQRAAFVFPAPFDTYDRGVGFYIEGLSGTRDGTIGMNGERRLRWIRRRAGLRLEAGRDLLRPIRRARRR